MAPTFDMNGLAASTQHRFMVTGEASPQLPLRLMGLFAQRDLLPVFIEMKRTNVGIAVTIEQHQLDANRALIILEKMRGLIEVEHAQLL